MENKSKKMTQHAWKIVYSVWVFFLFLTLVWMGSDSFVHYRGTDGWNQTTGVILSSEIITEKVEKSDTTLYEPQFEIEYQYKEKTYTSKGFERDTHWRYQVDRRSPEPAQQIIDQYPDGSEVTVYVNPWNRHDAVIYPDSGTTHIAEIIAISAFGLLFLTISISLLVSGIKGLRKDGQLALNQEKRVRGSSTKQGHFILEQDTSKQFKREKKSAAISLAVAAIVFAALLYAGYTPCIMFVVFLALPFLHKFLQAASGSPASGLEGKLMLKTHPVTYPGNTPFKLKFIPTKEESKEARPNEVLIRLCQVLPDGNISREIELYKTTLEKFKNVSPIELKGEFSLPEDLNFNDPGYIWEFQVTFPNSSEFEDTTLYFPTEVQHVENSGEEPEEHHLGIDIPSPHDDTFDAPLPVGEKHYRPRPVGPCKDASLFRPHLKDDEEILWTGKADKEAGENPGIELIVPWMGLFLLSVIIYTMISGYIKKGGALPIVVIIPLAMALVCIYIIKKQPNVRKSRRENSRYAVTNQRALILNSQNPEDVPLEIDLSLVTEVFFRYRMKEGQNIPSGDIAFSQEVADKLYALNSGSLNPILDDFAFQELADAEKVARLIHEINDCEIIKIETMPYGEEKRK